MIKEKLMPFVTAVAVLLAFCCALTLILCGGDTITAAAIQPDYIDQVFAKDQILQIDIQMEQAEWDAMLENARNEEYVACNLVVDGQTYYTVGIRPKGNSSLNMVASDDTTDRFSFKLDFDEYMDGQNLYGLSALALNNGIGDATYMKEFLSYQMMSDMGVNTPACCYVNITLNGEPWGLYLAVEVLEEDFLERSYSSNYGNLYKPEGSDMGGGGGKPDEGMRRPDQNPPAIEQSEQNEAIPATPAQAAPSAQPDEQQIQNFGKGGGFGGGGSTTGTNLVYTDDNLSSYSGIFDNVVTKSTTDADKRKVVEMMKNLSNKENLEEVLDVDEILRYFAVNTFLVNLDSYAGSLKHNYYLYEQNGIFQILPWDYNLSFAGHQVNDASRAINFPIDAPVSDSTGNSPLIEKLLEIDQYKQVYHSYLEQLVEYINSGVFANLIDHIDALISQSVQADATAFFPFEEYQQSLTQLKLFGTDRAKSILLQLSGSQPSDEYGTMETDLDLTALGTMGMNKGGMDRDKQFQSTENPDAENGQQNSPEVIQAGKNAHPQFNDRNPVATTALTSEQIFLLILYFSSIILGTILILAFRRSRYRSK